MEELTAILTNCQNSGSSNQQIIRSERNQKRKSKYYANKILLSPYLGSIRTQYVPNACR